MAIIFMDGAEKNSLDQWTVVNNATAYSSSGLDMSGSYVIKASSGMNCIEKTFSTSYSELYATFRYRIAQATNYNNGIIQFKDSAGTPILTIDRNLTSGLLEIRVGVYNATVVATGATYISLDTTYFLKVHYKPLDSGGDITVYLNGVAEVSYSGDTTAGLENVMTLRFGYTTSTTTSYAYFDDVIVSTTDITKNLRVGGKAITGAGTTTQWTPSTGANYSCVDEIPPASSDYNHTNTTNNIDTFALANITESVNSIAAVQVEMNAMYAGTPTPTHLRAVMRSGTTDYDNGADFSPPSSFGAPHVAIWETDPDTGLAFTESGFNALEIGCKATA
jgi:hypothetical protein